MCAFGCSSITGKSHDLDKWKSNAMQHVILEALRRQPLKCRWTFINSAGLHGDLDVIPFTHVPENISNPNTWDHATLCLCWNTMCRMKGLIISQYWVGRQNRFTKSFMGELPLLDQSLSQSLQLARIFCWGPHGLPLSVSWARLYKEQCGKSSLNSVSGMINGLL